MQTDDPSFVLPEGSQILPHGVNGPAANQVADSPVPMLGHVTSSYYSPILKRSIAMAVVKGGLGKMGDKISVNLNGKSMAATIASPVFYDVEGVRQHVE
jgi:sarcosine oxidase subunit alpha